MSHSNVHVINVDDRCFTLGALHAITAVWAAVWTSNIVLTRIIDTSKYFEVLWFLLLLLLLFPYSNVWRNLQLWSRV